MATLKQLHTFLTVAETLQMSEAAKRLYVSQPTVSQTILELEREFDATLFERTPPVPKADCERIPPLGICQAGGRQLCTFGPKHETYAVHPGTSHWRHHYHWQYPSSGDCFQPEEKPARYLPASLCRKYAGSGKPPVAGRNRHCAD